MPPRLIDAHLHLAEAAFADEAASVVRRAADAGVRFLVCNGTRPEDWPRVLDLAQKHPEVVACLGLHPWKAAEAPKDWLKTLGRMLKEAPSGVGEIGLDGAIEGPEALQEECFRLQLRLARKRRLPAMVHCVQAWGRLITVLKEEGPLPAGFLLHAYGGSPEMVGPLAGLGACFSFSAVGLGAGREKSLASLKAVPLDRLLLESDSTSPESGPESLPLALRRAAAHLGEEESFLADRLWENAQKFFGKLLER
ncbi:MAG TPA: TatD family deoxyribonuclease [Elusimicrobia bacterium]|nr:TatD family deoxyribonuclease [Elusimicrobiota bacterium]